MPEWCVNLQLAYAHQFEKNDVPRDNVHFVFDIFFVVNKLTWKAPI